MNRNNKKSNQKIIIKTNHCRSSANMSQLIQNIELHSIKQVHFLTTVPANKSLLKTYSDQNKSKFQHHFASTTQVISTLFYKKVYVPPHLNSSQVQQYCYCFSFTCMASQCANWKIRSSSSTKKLNYDDLYQKHELLYDQAVAYENRFKKRSSNSKIKAMLQHDRTRYQFRKPYKLYVQQRRGTQQDLSQQDSSVDCNSDQKISKFNNNPSTNINLNNRSDVKDQQLNLPFFLSKSRVRD